MVRRSAVGTGARTAGTSPDAVRRAVEGSRRLTRKPRRLVSGDRIGVVAPASGFDHDRFVAGVDA